MQRAAIALFEHHAAASCLGEQFGWFETNSPSAAVKRASSVENPRHVGYSAKTHTEVVAQCLNREQRKIKVNQKES